MARESLGTLERLIRRGLREGLSGREMLRQYRAGGGAIRTASFYRLLAEVRGLRALAPQVSQAPLNRRPTADEIGRLTTRVARGYRYDIMVTVRQRGTDRVFSRPITLRTRQLRSYGAMIQQAMGAFATLAEESDQVVYGATVIGVAEMVPGGE